MRWSEDSDSTGATRAAAPGMPVSPRTRRGSGGTRLSSPIRPNPLRLAQDDATPKDSATHDEPLFNPGRPLGPELLRNTRAAAALRPDRGGAARRSSAATSRGAVERRAATAAHGWRRSPAGTSEWMVVGVSRQAETAPPPVERRPNLLAAASRLWRLRHVSNTRKRC